MILLFGNVALGGVVATITDGALRPGRTATLEVAATDALGGPAKTVPQVQIVGATIIGPSAVRRGVWRWRLTPKTDADVVVVRSLGLEERLPVTVPDPTPLVVSDRIDAGVSDDAIAVRMVAADPQAGVLPLERIAIEIGEGTLLGIAMDGDAVVATFAPDDSPFPRIVPVGVRDRASDAQPVWTEVHLSARPKIPLEAEPGARLTLTVGGRSYGPFVADAQGRIDARVDQRPGEAFARARFVDDLGNVTRADLPLVTSPEPILTAFATGTLLPGRPPPLLYLFATGPVDDEAQPACRTPTSDLPMVGVGTNRWMMALPFADPVEDLRIACSLGDADTTHRVQVAPEVARHLGVRIGPEDLRTDFPVAEVRVVLEDLRGEGLPLDGVSVEAALGRVDIGAGTGGVARGEYNGESAVGAGSDEIVVRYRAPSGSGTPNHLEVAPSAVPVVTGGPLTLHARVLDASHRPLAGVPVLLAAEAFGRGAGIWTETETAEDGWASGVLELGPSPGPLILSARVGSALVSRGLWLPGEIGIGGPGTPDLEVRRQITISPGRVVGISMAVDPPVLRAGPGSLAYVSVHLEDRSGLSVVDEYVDLEASEGTVGPLEARPDGTLVAEYSPPAGERTREIEFTARTETLKSSTRLVLEPRVVRLSVGPWIGAQTNFGEVTGIAAGIDLDVRTRAPLFGESMMVRLGVHGTTFRSVAPTGVGPDADLRSTLVPSTAAVLFRDDRGPWSIWGGGGGVLAVHNVQVLFGDELVSAGNRLLVGPTLIGGVARRALGGELFVTLRTQWLPSTAADEIGYSGNLGGVAAGLGYRVVY